MRLKNTITLILILIFQMTHIHANESISIGYTAKYDNFEYFDYVNPYSKKGGHIVISAFGTYDSLNPFLLKSLSPAQIKLLKESGMVIGSHGVSHKLMSRLNKKDYISEIDDSFNFLKNYIDYKTFCYPYGGFHSFNSEIEELMLEK